MDNTAQYQRIEILDGFRALAIIAVLCYHFFYRWDDSPFPYFGANLFHYGFKGVSFFFMISGFVICFTLEKTNTFWDFWKKRFIRLFPSLLIASILTFSFLLIFDQQGIFRDSNHLRNLFTSLTLLPPNVFDWIFGTQDHFSYINYSYWSLWPELQFYALTSILFFAIPKNFKIKLYIAAFAFVLVYLLCDNIAYFNTANINRFFNLFNIVKNLPFFISGAIFYFIWKSKVIQWIDMVLLLFSFAMMIFPFQWSNLFIILVMNLLFILFIYYPQNIRFLGNSYFTSIGVASYFLYLIHEYIGVAVIKNIVSFFYPLSFIAPILMILILVIISIWYTQSIESRISRFLKQRLLSK